MTPTLTDPGPIADRLAEARRMLVANRDNFEYSEIYADDYAEAEAQLIDALEAAGRRGLARGGNLFALVAGDPFDEPGRIEVIPLTGLGLG